MTLPSTLMNILTEEQYNILAEKLEEEPFINLPIDWKVAEILNTPDPSLDKKKIIVDNKKIIEYLVLQQRWGLIAYKANEEPVSESNPIELKLLCKAIYDSLTIAETTDGNNPDTYGGVVALGSALVGATIISQDNLDYILNLFLENQSWAEVEQIPVTARIVGLTRGGL